VILDDEKIVPDALEFPQEDRKHIGLEIHSGQNRVVRRMFEKVGYKVTKLDRVSFAGLTKKNVARGKYRFLTPKEVAMLQMGAFE
jgi:23S rRNA pseudouridine2605 synthase